AVDQESQTPPVESSPELQLGQRVPTLCPAHHLRGRWGRSGRSEAGCEVAVSHGRLFEVVRGGQELDVEDGRTAPRSGASQGNAPCAARACDSITTPEQY